MPKELFLIFILWLTTVILILIFMFNPKVNSKIQKTIYLRNLDESNIEKILMGEIFKQKKYAQNVNIFCGTPISEEGKKILNIFTKKYDFIKKI